MIKLIISFLIFCCNAYGASISTINPDTDLSYLGAFRVPTSFYRGGYGMTYNPSANTLWLTIGNLNNEERRVAGEITIPAPINSKTASSLNRATIVGTNSPADITGGEVNENGDYHLGDVAYIGQQSGMSSSKLAWSIYYYYNASATNYESIGWSDFSTQTPNKSGAWIVSGNASAHGKYLFTVPDTWGNDNIGGRNLLEGRHRENSAFGSGYGPSLFALSPWNDGSISEGATISSSTILLYNTTNRVSGYSAILESNGAVWVGNSEKGSILFVGKKGASDGYLSYKCGPLNSGGFGYDWVTNPQPECVSCSGYSDWPYSYFFMWYSPNDIRDVYDGGSSYLPQPYSTSMPSGAFWGDTQVNGCVSYTLGGLAYAPAGTYNSVYGTLFVAEPDADGLNPIVHMFLVDEGVTPSLSRRVSGGGTIAGSIH